MYSSTVFPQATSAALLLLLAMVIAVNGRGQVGPFEPTAAINSATSDSGKCTQQKCVAYISTYLSGYQLYEQGFQKEADSFGSIFYKGPTLVQSRVDGTRGEFCSRQSNVQGIPSLATGIIQWGTTSSSSGKNEPLTTIYYDIYYPKTKSESVKCDNCQLKVQLRAYPTYGDLFTTSSTTTNENEVTTVGTCTGVCSSLKVLNTQKWCYYKEGTISDKYCSNPYPIGINSFIYFEDLVVTSGAASAEEEAFMAAMGPSTSAPVAPDTEETSADTPPTPTSSAPKNSPALFMMLPILAFFGILSNKRVLFLCVLLTCVVNCRAQPPKWRTTLATALGQVLGTYVDTLGKCSRYVSEVMIKTGIDGKRLQYYFYQSPVGNAQLSGPKLELINSNFNYGGYCGPSAPANIPADGFGTVIIGDSTWGMASAEATFAYKVYKRDGSPSNCILELYMNDHSQGNVRYPIYKLTPKGDCSDVPSLKIFQMRVGCENKAAGSDGCISDSKTRVNYYSTGFNVYFDDAPATAGAASVDDSSSTSPLTEDPSAPYALTSAEDNDAAASTLPAADAAASTSAALPSTPVMSASRAVAAAAAAIGVAAVAVL